MYLVNWAKGKIDNSKKFETKEEALAFRAGLKVHGVKSKFTKVKPVIKAVKSPPLKTKAPKVLKKK